MKQTLLKLILSAFTLLLVGNTMSGQYFVDFEGATKGGYATGEITLSGISWEITQGVIGTLDNDKKLGLRSLRLRRDGIVPGEMKMMNDKTGGIGTLSFLYARYGTEIGQPELTIQYSIDQGVNWINIGQINSYPEDLELFSVDVNIAGNVRIRIVTDLSGTNQRRLNIDNITISDFIGGTPVVSVPLFSPAGGNVLQPIEVELTSATEGATVFYSFESAEGPWTELEDVLNIIETTTIWAYAVKDEMDDSAVRTATYTFPTEVADVASLRAGVQDGRLYKLTGEAIVTLKVANRNQIYIQDATAGILIDDANPKKLTTEYNVGDGIEGLIGAISNYLDMIQFAVVTDPGGSSSTGNVVAPTEVTIADLDEHVAELVTVKGVSITRLNDGEGEPILNFASGTSYVINDGTAGTLRTVYVELDYIGTAIPISSQDITGVVLRFNDEYQLVPRSLADIVPSSTTGTSNPAVTSLSLFPNPVKDLLTIASQNSLARVEVVNALGSMVKSQNVSGHTATVSVASLPNGIYLIRITDAVGKITVSKVVKR
jgi:hypothetical protein